MNNFAQRIAVDLTPMLPGAENGGHKILVCELLSLLPKLAPSIQWILLTANDSHAEIKQFEEQNVKLVCVLQRKITPIDTNKKFNCNVFFRKFVHKKIKEIIKRQFRKKFPNDKLNILKKNNISLLFCPFMTSIFIDKDIPVVSIVADLQSLYYSNFFSNFEKIERELNYKCVFSCAQGIVTTTDFVKKTILEKYRNYPEKDIKIIPIQTASRLNFSKSNTNNDLLTELKLKREKYFVYPANAWLHKNHKVLFDVWLFLQTNFYFKNIKLVCTGESNDRMMALKYQIDHMHLNNVVIFPGFLDKKDLSYLLTCSLGMIYPSLYEGFGMPIIEAMRLGVPILCSNCASLPEVGGNAVLMFDPTRPQSIIERLMQFIKDSSLRDDLKKKGKIRAKNYDDPIEMTKQYLEFLRSYCK